VALCDEKDPRDRKEVPVRRLLLRAAAGLGVGLALLAGWPLAYGSEGKPAKTADCGCTKGHGTSVQFYDTPSDAAAVAKKEQKLVFVLHISGNFETPEFT
jgi:hypothetical protein